MSQLPKGGYHDAASHATALGLHQRMKRYAKAVQEQAKARAVKVTPIKRKERA